MILQNKTQYTRGHIDGKICIYAQLNVEQTSLLFDLHARPPHLGYSYHILP